MHTTHSECSPSDPVPLIYFYKLELQTNYRLFVVNCSTFKKLWGRKVWLLVRRDVSVGWRGTGGVQPHLAEGFSSMVRSLLNVPTQRSPPHLVLGVLFDVLDDKHSQ